jgi:uncharacterized protein
VKLPLAEPERDALRTELRRWDGLVASALLRVEAMRACRRYGEEFARRAEEGLARVALLPIDAAVLDVAAALAPPSLRSPDAIHLATALSLGDDLGAFVVYDERLRAAADAAGLPVSAPA